VLHGATEDRLGEEVTILGDVDGDGFDDALVGEPFAEDQDGYVYLFEGPLAASLATTDAHARFTSDSAGPGIGYAHWGADVNDDGLADAVLFQQSDAANDSGIHVFYGPIAAGDHAVADADLHLTGRDLGDTFGDDFSVGDVNGDAVPDILIGAGNDDVASFVNAGAAYLFYGPVVSDMTGADADLILNGTGTAFQAGRMVVAEMDVNGDGRSDIIVSEDQNDTNGFGAGVVYVFFGEGL